MRTLRKSVWIVALTSMLAAATPPATAQDTKTALIRELMAITNSMELADQMHAVVSQKMIDMVLGRQPGISAKILESLKSEIVAEFRDSRGEIESAVIDIYARNFSEAEIGGLVEFYKTPLGKKVIQQMPAISAESMAFGLAWGQRVGERAGLRVMRKARELGVNL